ncbi:hypothetical protein D3C73_1514440 [compost metagenome]
MLPSPTLTSRVSLPAAVSARKTSPKDVPTANQRPSGLASKALVRVGAGKSSRRSAESSADVGAVVSVVPPTVSADGSAVTGSPD